MKEVPTRLLTSKELGMAVSEELRQPKNQTEAQNGVQTLKQHSHIRRALLPPPIKETSNPYIRDFLKWREADQSKMEMYAEQIEEANKLEEKQKKRDTQSPSWEKILENMKDETGNWKVRLPKGWQVYTADGRERWWQSPEDKLLLAHDRYVNRFPPELRELANYHFWQNRYGSFSHVKPPEMLDDMNEGILPIILTALFEAINVLAHSPTEQPSEAQ